MTSSSKNSRGQAIVGRLIASLTIGVMMLALGASAAFAGTSAGCEVTYGGRITALNGDEATFGGNATSAGSSGQEQFRDHGPAAAMTVHSIAVTAVTCSPDGTAATILGTAQIGRVGPVRFTINLTDLGKGRSDTYQLQLSTGYDTGVQHLRGGNVRIH